MEQIEHIFLDIDGVLADFMGGVSELFDKDVTAHDSWNVYDALDLSPQEFWGKISQTQMFWANLKPYPWARDLVNLCLETTKGNVTLVTSPSYDAKCYAEKYVWVRKHFPTMTRKLFIGPEKHLLAKPNTILIDDNDSNCRKFREAGGKVITFPQPWNEERYANVKKFDFIEECLTNIV